MQRGSPPPLLPLLRSKLQAEVLALVLLGPEQEWSLTDLASRAGVSVSSVQREVDRAEQAGVVSSRRLGSTVQGAMAGPALRRRPGGLPLVRVTREDCHRDRVPAPE